MKTRNFFVILIALFAAIILTTSISTAQIGGGGGGGGILLANSITVYDVIAVGNARCVVNVNAELKTPSTVLQFNLVFPSAIFSSQYDIRMSVRVTDFQGSFAWYHPQLRYGKRMDTVRVIIYSNDSPFSGKIECRLHMGTLPRIAKFDTSKFAIEDAFLMPASTSLSQRIAVGANVSKITQAPESFKWGDVNGDMKIDGIDLGTAIWFRNNPDSATTYPLMSLAAAVDGQGLPLTSWAIEQIAQVASGLNYVCFEVKIDCRGSENGPLTVRAIPNEDGTFSLISDEPVTNGDFNFDGLIDFNVSPENVLGKTGFITGGNTILPGEEICRISGSSLGNFSGKMNNNRPIVLKVEGTTDVVEEISGSQPEVFSLAQNYPNPFNPTTTISFSLPSASFVTLKVYNVLGEEVAELVNAEQPAGTHEFSWDASAMPSGVYTYRLRAGTYTETKKMLLVK